VFDCIPATDPERHLSDPIERRRYLARFRLLRAADHLLVLSRSVGADLTRLLGVPASRISSVGAAADARFAQPASRQDALLAACTAMRGLAPPFVLYPSGSHPRKNNEALVLAWARLPQRLMETYQLVITGEMPAALAHHYRLLAERLGLRGRVVVAGDVDADTYLHLVQAADLVCFPSLAEGFGLPVAEALACATPAIASDVPPFDELLPRHRRFDPTSPAGIALGVLAALAGRAAPPGAVAVAGGMAGADGADPAAHTLRRTLEEGGRCLDSWSDVGQASAAAFSGLLAARRRLHSSGALEPAPRTEGVAPAVGAPTTTAPPVATARRRRRVAVVSPFPPSPSGVAAYSYRLVEELARLDRFDIDLFADGPTSDQRGPDGPIVSAAGSLPVAEALSGRYDEVVYVLGNSHHHLGALATLRRRPGVVVCHDVRLGNLYVAEHGDLPRELRSLPRALQRIYGPDLPDDVGVGTVISAEQERRHGLLLAREVIASSRACLVSSHAARELALSDVPGRLAGRVGLLPFAIEAPPVPPGSERPAEPAEALALATGLAQLDALGTAPLVAHFGIVDPAKQPQLIVESFARLRPSEPAPARLAFVGPVAETLADELRALAERLGVGRAVLLTGAVPAAVFRAFVERATVAVQPRSQFNGEASAAVGQCLACGVPTVVSDLGWMSELPDASVLKVPPGCSPATLASAVQQLLDDEPRRQELSWAAREVARRQGFDVTAAALADVIEELSRRP
jgi:glycosyltransferase involved in cell wall biosynthesis